MLEFLTTEWSESLDVCDKLSFALHGRDYWNDVLEWAVEGMNPRWIDHCIGMGASNPDAGLRGAIRVGDSKLIHRFIERGASDWRGATIVAIQRRNFRLSVRSVCTETWYFESRG